MKMIFTKQKVGKIALCDEVFEEDVLIAAAQPLCALFGEFTDSLSKYYSGESASSFENQSKEGHYSGVLLSQDDWSYTNEKVLRSIGELFTFRP